MTYKEAKKEIMFLEMNLDYRNPNVEVLRESVSRLKLYILETHNKEKSHDYDNGGRKPRQ